MTRYSDEPRSPRLRHAALVVVAVLVGVLIGRGTAGSDGGRSVSASGAPTDQRSGVPTGYPHSEGGAASAAANLSATLAYSVAQGPGQVKEVAGQVGTASYASRVAAAYQDRQVLDPSATVLFRAVPITYRVLSYSDDRAAVRIWSVSILAGEDSSPGAASFKTATIVVRWTNGDWKVDDVQDAVPGPTPVTASPTGGSEFVADLGDSEAFLVTP